MHPIERLRFVARSAGDSPAVIAAEAALALAEIAEIDEVALVPACKQLISMHPAKGPVWWVASRLMLASDLASEAQACIYELESDGTGELLRASLAGELPVNGPGSEVLEGLPDVLAFSKVSRLLPPSGAVVLESPALSGAGLFAAAGSRSAARAASESGIAVWVAAGVGCVVPPAVWQAMVRLVELEDKLPSQAARARFERRLEVAEMECVSIVVGPGGPESSQDSLHRADWEVPAELLALGKP